jgi:hypothetical protein
VFTTTRKINHELAQRPAIDEIAQRQRRLFFTSFFFKKACTLFLRKRNIKGLLAQVAKIYRLLQKLVKVSMSILQTPNTTKLRFLCSDLMLINYYT